MIELALLPQHLQVMPGGLGRCNITLHTDDLQPADYTLSVHGLEGGWFTVSVTRLSVAAGFDGPAILTLHPPPEAAEGVYPFELIAIRLDDPEQVARVDALVVVEGESPEDAPIAAYVAPAVVATAPVGWSYAAWYRQLPVWVPLLAGVLVLLCVGVAVGLATRTPSSHHVALPCGTRPCSTATTFPAGFLDTPQPTSTIHVTSTSGALPRPTSEPQVVIVPSTLTPQQVFAGMPDSPEQLSGPSLLRTPVKIHPATETIRNTPSPTDTTVPTDSPTALPSNTQIPTASPSASSTVLLTPTPPRIDTPVATMTPMDTATSNPTVVPSDTATSTRLPTHTVTRTPTPPLTATPVPTATRPPTVAPTETVTTTSSPLPTRSVTPVNTITPVETSTPAAVTLRYGSTVTADAFILQWKSTNATSIMLDNQSVPVNGQQSFPLRTHTFVLTATGQDGAQTAHVIAVVLMNGCTLLINGQRTAIPSVQCVNQAVPTATSSPSATSLPPKTDTPVPPTVLTPSATVAAGDSTVPSATAVAGGTVTGIATPSVDDTAFPTDTPTPGAGTNPTPQ